MAVEDVLSDGGGDVSTRLIGWLHRQDVFDGGRSGGRRPQQQQPVEDRERLDDESYQLRAFPLHRAETTQRYLCKQQHGPKRRCERGQMMTFVYYREKTVPYLAHQNS